MAGATRFIDKLKKAARLDPVKKEIVLDNGDEVVMYVTPLTAAERERAKKDARSDDPGAFALQLLIRKAPSIEDCCNKLPEIATRIPHFQPMAFWLDRWPNPLADRVFTGRQERFDADLQLLFDQLGVPLNLAWLQRSNSSGPLQAASPDTGISAAALEQLQAFYAEDFRRFGYSLEPAGSER